MALTPYKNVNEFLSDFLKEVTQILGGNFVGMYLYGSLALEDFDPASSDLDILVVTSQPVSPEETSRLKEIHSKIENNKSTWAHRLEVSYMSLKALKRYDPFDNRYPLVSPVSPFGIIEHGKDWIINRSIIREKGIIVSGPSPKTLIDEISSDDIKKVTKELLCEQWSKHVDGPDWMKPRKYQAFTVITMCRMLYTIQTGEVASKAKATEWAMKNLDEKWVSLIKRSVLWRYDPVLDDMDETLEFLRFVVRSQCPN